MDKIKKCAFIFVIALILEVLVFNFRFYESLLYKDVHCTYEIEDGTVLISDIDAIVRNVYIDIEHERSDISKLYLVEISVSDESSENRYALPEREIYTDVKKSKYINLNLSGRCRRMLIKITNDELKDKEIRISSVKLNVTRVFDFHISRIIVVAMLIGLFDLAKNSKKYSKDSLFAPGLNGVYNILGFVALNVAIVIFLTHANGYFYPNSISHQRQYNYLAHSLKNGKLYLDMEVPDYLENMDNPYDTDAREMLSEKYDEDYLWDVAYFNGKYYVYFGIVPELIAYLPPAILTIDVENANVICIVEIFLIIGIMWLIYELAKRYCKPISVLYYLFLCQVAIISSNVWYMAKRPDFYVVPIVFGITFTVYGITLWLTSVEKGRRLNFKRLVLGSVCMALVAGCRPNLILLSALSVVIIGPILLEQEKKIKYILGFIMPYVIVAAAIMWYNYARFGSPLEFGAKYNLTISDMTHRGFSLDRIGMGLFAYLFQPLSLNVRFPYLKRNYLDTYYQGNTNIENPFAGIFLSNVFTSLSLCFFVFREKLKRMRGHLLGISLFILGLIVVILDIEAGGIYLRYTNDFAFIFAICAVLVAMHLYKAEDNTTFKKVAVIMAFFTLGYNFLAIFTDVGLAMKVGNPILFNRVRQMFEFWL